VKEFVNEGWKVVMDNEQLIELRKPVLDLIGGLDEASEWIITQPDLIADGPDESSYFCFNPEPIASIERKEGLNVQFRLKGYPIAEKVYVAGSFNHWDPKATALSRVGDHWEKEVYLRQGSYTYKFVVDGEWITDPNNPNVVKDGEGNFNSLLLFGESTLFQLKGYESAREVYLAGSFNDWRPEELAMEKAEGGWFIPYVLAPGNYEYKFVVDGQWILDPANVHTVRRDGQAPNSFISIHPNHTFKCAGHLSAENVSLMVNVMGWPDPGVSMNKGKDGWYIPMYLPEGKCAYKFKIDGQYEVDPAAPYLEDNEYNTQNSVFWVE